MSPDGSLEAHGEGKDQVPAAAQVTEKDGPDPHGTDAAAIGANVVGVRRVVAKDDQLVAGVLDRLDDEVIPGGGVDRLENADPRNDGANRKHHSPGALGEARPQWRVACTKQQEHEAGGLAKSEEPDAARGGRSARHDLCLEHGVQHGKRNEPERQLVNGVCASTFSDKSSSSGKNDAKRQRLLPGAQMLHNRYR